MAQLAPWSNVLTRGLAGPAGLQGVQGLMGPQGPQGDLRSSAAAQPVNTAKLFISSGGWNPITKPIAGLTTPTSAQHVVGDYFDVDRLAPPPAGPGEYRWGIFGYLVNTGTAPVTPIAGRGRGQSVYVLSGTGRGYGSGIEVHGLEVTVGAFASEADAQATNGDPILRNIAATEDGSRFHVGQVISSPTAGFPVGATIIDVVGRPGGPTTITLSAAPAAMAVSPGVVHVVAQPLGTTETIGALITGNGGTAAGGGNPAGIGLQFQAYDPESAMLRAINLGASALLPAGVGFRMASVVADRGLSLESCTLSNGLIVSGGTYSGGVIAFSAVSAASAISIPASNTFTIAALNLPGQSIATDTATGLIIATSATQRLGFFGRAGQPRPTLGVPVATDLATCIALTNAMRAAFIQTGGGLGLVAA